MSCVRRAALVACLGLAACVDPDHAYSCDVTLGCGPDPYTQSDTFNTSVCAGSLDEARAKACERTQCPGSCSARCTETSTCCGNPFC